MSNEERIAAVQEYLKGEGSYRPIAKSMENTFAHLLYERRKKK